MELKDRLKQARKHAGMTQKDVEKNIPNMKQSTYSELERGISKSTSRIVELATLFKVNAEWLATGAGDMQSTSDVLDDYVVVGAPGAQELSTEEYLLIPQYDVFGSCGTGTLVGDVTVKGGLVFKRSWLSSLNAKPENLATIYAQGDSMSPTIEDGQVLLVDTADIEPRSSMVYLLCIDEQLYIKRLVNIFDGWMMRSDNQDKNRYPDVSLTPERMVNIDIQGRIIWKAGLL